MSQAQALAEATPDDTSAAEAASWLNNPVRREEGCRQAQLLDEPEWTGSDYDGEDE